MHHILGETQRKDAAGSFPHSWPRLVGAAPCQVHLSLLSHISAVPLPAHINEPLCASLAL